MGLLGLLNDNIKMRYYTTNVKPAKRPIAITSYALPADNDRGKSQYAQCRCRERAIAITLYALPADNGRGKSQYT